MPKFKPGDKVRVKTLEQLKSDSSNMFYKNHVEHIKDGGEYGGSFVFPEMSAYCCQIVTIERLIKSQHHVYEYEITGNAYSWADWMFEDKTWIRYQKLRKLYEV